MAPDKRLFYATRKSMYFSILTVGLGLICDSFLYAFIVPLLPQFLEDRVSIPPENVQKAVSVTLGVFGFCAMIGCPCAGLIADWHPRRSVPFLAGLAFLAVGTAIFLTARTFPLLIVARALQGFSTAIVWTVGLAMLLDRVGAARMGVTVGGIFGVMGAAQLAAPTLGGWVYEKAGMKALSAIALGIVVLDFSMRVAVIEEPETGSHKPENHDEAHDRTSADSSDVTATATAPIQHSEETPLLDPEQDARDTKMLRYPLPSYVPSWASSFPVIILIQDPRILAAQMVTFTQSFQFAAIDTTLPLELESRLGFTPGPISLMILPWVLPFVIFDPIFGRLVDRKGPKVPTLVGVSCWAVILLLMRLPIVMIEQGKRSAGIGVWVALLMLNGIAAASVGSGGIVIVGQVAEGYIREHPTLMIRKGGKGPFAQLFSINGIVFHAGLTAGPAAAGSLRSSIGYANMNAVLAVLLAVTALICYIYMDGWPVCGRGYEAQVKGDEHDSTHLEQ